MINDLFFADLCERELALCAVKRGETVAVVAEATADPRYADAFMAAATRLGASTFTVLVPRVVTDDTGAIAGGYAGEGVARSGLTGITALGTNPAAVAALSGADLVVDRVNMLFSAEQHRLLDAGKRILTCFLPVDNLVKLFPTVAMRERTEAAVELLDRARTLRFTNAAGTDVVYKLGTYQAAGQYGYTDTPGRWDHWPSGGFVYSGGDDDGVDGTVVLAPGDLLFPQNRYVSEPITVTIEAGRIQDIRGGVDAALMREFMAGFEDSRGYAISHIGWGLEPRSRWGSWALDPRSISMEGRSFAGSVMFSTGPNTELRRRDGGWGTNNTPCHLDIPMCNCSLYLDDEPVVLGGALVGEVAAVAS